MKVCRKGLFDCNLPSEFGFLQEQVVSYTPYKSYLDVLCNLFKYSYYFLENQKLRSPT